MPTMRYHARPALNTPTARAAIRLLKERLSSRFGIELDACSDALQAQLVLDIDEGTAGPEGFQIRSGDGGQLQVVGHGARGLLYGVGQFLHTCDGFGDRFRLSSWRGTSTPARPVRGMYFATHFHNFYHCAPIERVEAYIEDLALWGCNALGVWFDLHHFTGIDEPDAPQMIARLKAMLRKANEVGMAASLTTLANEAYAGSPERLRADPQTGRAHYGVELCPSIPEGRELLLTWRREMLEAFSDIDVRYMIVWPYDQGGCACERCRPWGANGFLRIGGDMAQIAREVFPDCQVILSTWLFDFGSETGGPDDQGEWRGLDDAFAQRQPWADYIMADSHWETFPRYPIQHGSPGGLALLNFPEISMFAGGPWGGFGAIPAPSRFQHLWDQVGDRLAGGFPYSEGIFEDINKVICLRHYWGDEPACDTVARYCRAYFGDQAAPAIAEAIGIIEQTQGNHIPAGPVAPGEPVYRRNQIGDVERAVLLLEQAQGGVPDAALEGWRWRVLWIRAQLDREIHNAAGQPTDCTESLLAELEAMYAVTPDSIDWVAPPTRSRLIKRGWQVATTS